MSPDMNNEYSTGYVYDMLTNCFQFYNNSEIELIFDELMLIQYEREHKQTDYYAWCQRKVCNK